jgi:5-hydroxyisourate hydrolase
MSRITTEAIDGIYGQAAEAVEIRLDQLCGDDWVIIARARTDRAGRVDEWDRPMFERGLYRIAFDIDRYFGGVGLRTVYPEIEVVFRIRNGRDHCLIRVVLATSSYSTHFAAGEY